MSFVRPPGFKVNRIVSRSVEFVDHHDDLANHPAWLVNARRFRAKINAERNVERTKDVPNRVGKLMIAAFERLRTEMVDLHFRLLVDPRPMYQTVISYESSMDSRGSGKFSFITWPKGYRRQVKVQFEIKEHRSPNGPGNHMREIFVFVDDQILNPSNFNERYQQYMNRGYGLRHILLDLIWPALIEKQKEADQQNYALNRAFQRDIHENRRNVRAPVAAPAHVPVPAPVAEPDAAAVAVEDDKIHPVDPSPSLATVRGASEAGGRHGNGYNNHNYHDFRNDRPNGPPNNIEPRRFDAPNGRNFDAGRNGQSVGGSFNRHRQNGVPHNHGNDGRGRDRNNGGGRSGPRGGRNSSRPPGGSENRNWRNNQSDNNSLP